MEQHPVPQNVTTFQFRLIGDMTLKQFGYLAGGAILAFIFYKLPFPLFLNWPLAIIFALGGFGFAFVPIEERPMDVWVLSFFKSIYSPTQYVWSRDAGQKTAGQPPSSTQASTITPSAPNIAPPQTHTLEATAQPSSRRGDILSMIFTPPSLSSAALNTPSRESKSKGFLDWLFELLTPRPKTDQPLTGKPQVALAHQASYQSTIHTRMDFTPPPAVRARSDVNMQTVKKSEPPEPQKARVMTVSKEEHEAVQKRLAELQAQKEQMEAELARLRVQHQPKTDQPMVGAPPPPKPTGTYVATPAAKQGPSVRIITADRAVKVGIPRLTTFPNVVTGIVKDGDQNLLPGVLITVKDKDGIPMRALKTNRLGQFAASTPLTNGTYFVEIEDPRLRYTFDRAQITLNGSIVPALEIFAKSQKEITRAKLTKELFGDKIQ